MIEVYEYKGKLYVIKGFCHVKDSVLGWNLAVMYVEFASPEINRVTYVRIRDDFDMKFKKVNH